MPRRIKIAAIGTGRMGSVHVRNLVHHVPEADLVAICDIRLDVAQAVADELGITRVVKDYHELLADPEIEAVLIATSTNTHAMIIRDAANAGKHIFCEKPIALDLAEIDEALAAVKKAGVKLQIGFNRRFDKSFQRVTKLSPPATWDARASSPSPTATRCRHPWNLRAFPAVCSWICPSTTLIWRDSRWATWKRSMQWARCSFNPN